MVQVRCGRCVGTGLSSWYRVVTTPAEGIATEHPPTSQPNTLAYAVLAHGLHGVFCAGWGETTGRRKQRRKKTFITMQQGHQSPARPTPWRAWAPMVLAKVGPLGLAGGDRFARIHAVPPCCKTLATSCSSTMRVSKQKSGRTVMTISLAGGNCS